MGIGKLCIERPVMTTLVMFAIVLFGVLGYQSLPISNLPNVDFPTIQVTSTLPGASAETMASAVSIPLEKQFATIAGLIQMTSASTLGQSLITLQFDPSRNIDGAALDVQASITAASKQLPPQMIVPPTFAKVNPASQPVIYLSVSSETLPLHKVDYYAETIIAQRISRVSGVAQVQVNGSQQFAVRVQVNPERMTAYGMGMDDVMTAVANANQNQPVGTLWGTRQAFTIESNGQLFSAAQYQPIIIGMHNNFPVRLNQIANVIDSVQNDKEAGYYNGRPAVVLAVLRQPGANTIQVVDQIKDLLPNFRALIPNSVHLDVMYDQSQTIRDSVNDVESTLVLTVVLVVFVIFVFLGNLSATFIPSLALPISIIGTFAAMKLLGFSLNNLSLMALSLSVGYVVDDAIVMLENIVRHIEMGKPAMRAALDGAQEIGFTILSMTLSLIAVFIPVLLLPGIVGRLFNEFSVTISVAILISGFISMTFTPMLCSRFLRQKSGPDNIVIQTSNAIFTTMLDFYSTSLHWTLKHKLLIVGLFFVMLAATALLFGHVTKGFMPSEDVGQILAMTEGEQGISFDGMVKRHQKLVEIIQQDPNVESTMSSIGVGNGSPNLTLNQGRIVIVLKPANERSLKVDQVIKELTPKLAVVEGINAYLQNPPQITIGGQVTKSLYQYTLSSPDTKLLYKVAKNMLTSVKDMPGIIDVTTDLQVDNPEVHVTIDRDRLSQLGLTMQQVEDVLDSAYSARQISTMYTTSNQYWVIIEVEPKFYRDPSVLHRLYVHSTSTGQLVPLDSVAAITIDRGPLIVNHLGQFPSVTISFNLRPDASLGDAVNRIKSVAKKIVPPAITTAFQGTADAFDSSLSNLWMLLILAVVVIYIVLGILYESFIHPITILSGLPSAALGALIILIVFHKDLDIYGFLGLIMLIGIVKKNAIMMIDFAVDAQRNQNKNSEEAIFQACVTRFRPIMMTTMAALMGGIPIALGIGAGAEARQPLGLTVVGGLLVSQMVTLYITPVFYIYFDRLQRRVLKSRSTLVTPAMQ